ncbi:hypothetical protein SDC9_123635 [bioreactor metagenome]|uniref:Uncharacterized protein n=1 Tax=bioreactor metagenome TaxID=1076179 RepID=A0A645CI50_9ZZZZ
MKLILEASIAFAAYLVISAEEGSIRNKRSSGTNGAYSSRIIERASSETAPTTTLSGCRQSSIAIPSFRNSGFERTSRLIFSSPLSCMWALMRFQRSVPVPTGTVDLTTMKHEWSMHEPILSSALSTCARSALPSLEGGVPTAMKQSWAFSSPSLMSVEKVSLPSFMFFFTRSSSPGSYMGIIPRLSSSILFLSMSTQQTSFPFSAKQVPVTRPT